MNLRPWISVVLNLSFPGAGYLYIGKKLAGSIFLFFTTVYIVWYYFIRTTEANVSIAINSIYSIVAFILAFDVYYRAKEEYLVGEKTEKFTVKTFLRRSFIGLYMFFLLIGIILLYSNLKLHFGWPNSVYNSASVIFEPVQAKISEFLFDVIISLSFLMIPILSYNLKLKRIPIKRIIFSFVGVIILFFGMYVWSTRLDMKSNSGTSSVKKDFTSNDLMIAFNDERAIYGAQPAKSNQYVCKIAEERLNDVLTHGVEVLHDQESLEKAYFKVKAMEYSSQATKESHVPDNVFVLFTDKATVEDAIREWRENFEVSYLFSDKYIEFGCAVVNDGYGIMIVGSDNEPFEPKLDADKPNV